MAPSAAINIPTTTHEFDQSFSSSQSSADDAIFSPLDSIATSLSTTSLINDYLGGEFDLDDGFATAPPPAVALRDDEAKREIARIDETNAVAFGQGPDKWLYHPRTGLFDLTRQAPVKVHLASFSDNMNGILLDPARTMLVVIDMQNFFVHPACYVHKGGLAAVEPIVGVMNRCRQLGIKVSFLNWVIEDKDMVEMPPAVQRGWSADRMRTHGIGWHTNLGSELPNGQGRCLWKDSWNADLYDPIKAAARPEDITFLKNRPSGMWNPDCNMAQYMIEHNIKTILFAGVNTDQCVLGTLTDCYSKSYDCILISDCVGTATSGMMAQELVEYNVARNYGFVVDSGCIARSEIVTA